jgi:signal recognition particle GTPase
VDQLVTLAKQVDVGCHSEPGVTDVVGIVKRGIVEAGKARARTVLVDTAGRLQIDAGMMDELKALKAAIKPHEILLVADGMTGQDAVRIASGFHDALGVTGVILTKMDGDARGRSSISVSARSSISSSRSGRNGSRGGFSRRETSSPSSRRRRRRSIRPKPRNWRGKRSPRRAWIFRTS